MRLPPCLLLLAAVARGQGNYEVQVYPAQTVAPRTTMIEFHSNVTVQGTKTVEEGVLPTHHAFHETIEITHGFNEWFETGWYIFTSLQADGRYLWVGDHIRPRFAIPERFRLPLGISISNEIGYQRPSISADTWTWEIRPILDKKWGRWYGSFNPTVDRSFHGPESKRGFEFSPNFKLSYDVHPKVSLGFEYYGALGPVTGFDPLRVQQQQIMPTLDLNLGPQWEFNLAVGFGVTRATDHLLVKMIIGYRFKL